MLIQHDHKRMARVLREKLGERGVSIPHSACLEIVAAQFGARDWNTLAALSKGEKATGHLIIPEGWHFSGKEKELYACGLDPSMVVDGNPALLIHRLHGEDATGDEFAGLMQVFDAHSYSGGKVAFTARLKASQITGSGTIWMRVDGAGGMLAFDNMETRDANGALHGDSDWVQRRIVLDVPQSAERIAFGCYLSGTGSLWCAGFSVEKAIEQEEPTTALAVRKQPENLDWTKVSEAHSLGYGFGPRSRARTMILRKKSNEDRDDGKAA